MSEEAVSTIISLLGDNASALRDTSASLSEMSASLADLSVAVSSLVRLEIAETFLLSVLAALLLVLVFTTSWRG